ncbi:MAG: response regulator transcription factor [Lachnospiraceae bacterium]|nr:response regulator transcription factor [Lachnospiraceae bacterium]
MAYILVADDNTDITDVLSVYIKKEGHDPVIAGDGIEAMERFREYNPACVLLDVMMPREDGYEVLRKIRACSNVPVIMITARGEDFERIMGLDIGADDYIVKPFSPSEVMARVRAVMRRMNMAENTGASDNKLVIKDLTINLDEYSLYIGKEKINLTKTEIETMWTLAKNPNKVFTRDNLLDSLWGYDYYGDSRTVDSHIKRLRAKIDAVEHPGWKITTIWGVGYKFEVE